MFLSFRHLYWRVLMSFTSYKLWHCVIQEKRSVHEDETMKKACKIYWGPKMISATDRGDAQIRAVEDAKAEGVEFNPDEMEVVLEPFR